MLFFSSALLQYLSAVYFHKNRLPMNFFTMFYGVWTCVFFCYPFWQNWIFLDHLSAKVPMEGVEVAKNLWIVFQISQLKGTPSVIAVKDWEAVSPGLWGSEIHVWFRRGLKPALKPPSALQLRISTGLWHCGTCLCFQKGHTTFAKMLLLISAMLSCPEQLKSLTDISSSSLVLFIDIPTQGGTLSWKWALAGDFIPDLLHSFITAACAHVQALSPWSHPHIHRLQFFLSVFFQYHCICSVSVFMCMCLMLLLALYGLLEENWLRF